MLNVHLKKIYKKIHITIENIYNIYNDHEILTIS